LRTLVAVASTAVPRAGAEWAGVSDVVGRSSNVSAMQSSTVQQDEQTGRQTGAVPSLIPAHGNDLTRVVRPPLKCSCMTRRVSTTSILPSRSFERLRGAQRPLRCHTVRKDTTATYGTSARVPPSSYRRSGVAPHSIHPIKTANPRSKQNATARLRRHGARYIAAIKSSDECANTSARQ
jgi:hypothetical protein